MYKIKINREKCKAGVCGGLCEKVCNVRQVEKEQVSFENRTVYSSVVPEQ